LTRLLIVQPDYKPVGPI